MVRSLQALARLEYLLARNDRGAAIRILICESAHLICDISQMKTKHEFLLSKVNELKAEEFVSLVQMPSYQDKQTTVKEGEITVAIWKDLVGNEVQIVVQVYQHKILGIGLMQALGFRRSPNKLTDMSASELESFT